MTNKIERFEQVPEPMFSKGTVTSCSYCRKKFGPDHIPSKKNVHYIFRVRTKYATYTGPTHMNCVEQLQSRQLPEFK